jgi:uncharacterized protein (TIGR03067 family)
MISRRDWMVLGVAAVLSAVVGVQVRGADEKPDPELKKLEGKWTTPSGEGGKVTYTFKGTKLKIEAPSRTYEMTVKIDSTAKPDKTIDFKIDEAPDDAKGKTSKGIYKFDGDDKIVLSYCPMGDRPTKYEQNGYEQILSTLTKVKD